jgi:hypothetical protein
VHGKPHLLVNALVTGLKHWHLRPSCTFYPKANFYHMMDRIPMGSKVVFMFGEIDCREGIVVAVEKGRYQTIEEGVAVCVGIFRDAILAVVERYKFQVYIHPIVPVLTSTRPMVKAYNATLRAMVDAEAALTWLDFFPQLLSPDGRHLRQEFKIDSVHMNPAYLPHLRDALEKVA